MNTALIQQKLKALLCCVFATGLALCSHLCSAIDYQQGDIMDFGFTNSHTSRNAINLTPISAMSDETLFLAAAAERDNLMHPTQRKANSHWLRHSNAQHYTGFAALRKLITLSLLTYVPALDLRKHNHQQHSPSDQSSQFANLDNYRLDFSSDAISLGFQYRF